MYTILPSFSWGKPVCYSCFPDCLTCQASKTCRSVNCDCGNSAFSSSVASHTSLHSILSASVNRAKASKAPTFRTSRTSPCRLSRQMKVSIDGVGWQRYLPRPVDMRFIWKLPHGSPATCKWFLPFVRPHFVLLPWTSNWWGCWPFWCKRSCWWPAFRIQRPSHDGLRLYPAESSLFHWSGVEGYLREGSPLKTAAIGIINDTFSRVCSCWRVTTSSSTQIQFQRPMPHPTCRPKARHDDKCLSRNLQILYPPIAAYLQKLEEMKINWFTNQNGHTPSRRNLSLEMEMWVHLYSL